MKDRPLPSIDDVIAEIKGMTIEEIVKAELAEGGPWLITVDMLRAAGALDCPPEMRRSLGAGPLKAAASDEETLPLFAAARKDASRSPNPESKA